MSIFDAVILGLVQGLTEFLPVSSSGHLLLAESILGVRCDTLFFSLSVHLGTLIAVCIVFCKDILVLFKKPYKNILMLIVATIPAGAVGVLLEDFLGEIFNTPTILIFTFLLTAVLLFVAQRVRSKKTITPIGYPTALLMGIGQAFAILPGLSRSGTTICVGLLCNKKKDEISKFSFLMSIPVILGGIILKSIELTISISQGATLTTLGVDILPTIIATIFAGISGYMAIRWMIRLISKGRFTAFSVYLAVLSLVVFVNSYVVSMW